MSDDWICFVPTDPRAQPTKEAAERAAQLLASYAPEADEVCAKFHDETTLFDPCGNWEGVAAGPTPNPGGATRWA
jgi:hypothetical protein